MKALAVLVLTLPCLAAEPWENGLGHRSRPLAVPPTGRSGFTRLSSETTGISFSNQLSDATAAKNRILENGSGVALGDVDGDGLCDIYFCRLEGPNVLYRNLGNWKFEDVTARAGVACPDQYSTGAVFADVDGDDDLDLLVNSIGGGTRLFLNDGRGLFKESRDSGLDRTLGSTSMALADFDGDGDLDLYVANYRVTTIKDSPPGVRPEARMVNGRIVVTPPDRFMALTAKDGAVTTIELGEPDIFYRNDGKGHFTPVSWTGGLFLDEEGKALTEPPRNWCLSVVFRDFNGDGAPDLYLCNDFLLSPDQFWLNEGGNHFRAAPRLAWRNMSMSSMCADVADIDRDGQDDFFVAEMLSRDHVSRHRQRANAQHLRALNPPVNDLLFRPEFLRNTLYRNRGDATYAEIAQFSGVDASEWTWSAVFLDVDLDGYEDLLITNGNMHDVLDADTLKAIAAPRQDDAATRHLKDLLKFPRIEAANLCFRNRGDLTFEEVGAAWGFDWHGISHGMALADLDNDGDLDVVVNNLNAPAGIHRNNSAAPRIAVRLKGKAPNGRGIGANIRWLGGPMPQSQSIICGSRYLSGDDPMRTFAAGSATNVSGLEVTWRSGLRSVVPNAKANRLYEVFEETATRIADRDPVISQKPKVLFDDVSHLLGHRHVEEPFDDLQAQPLLSRRLSRLGPGVAWFDVNGDGWQDLIIGSGRGGRMAVFTNNAKGGFGAFQSAAVHEPEARDQTGVLGWRKEDGQTVVLAGSSNYEDATTNGAMLRIFNFATHAAADGYRARAAAPGPLAMADLDGDGHLDLFVGGRVLPRRYPEPASPVLFRNEDGRFRPDTENSRRLARVGLVSGAVFSDIDGDGDADLILACEWGPLKIFRNDQGKLMEWNAPVSLQSQASTLDQLTGWWNGVTTGDFDGDGRLDIVASNWGRNTQYRRHLDQPLRIFWGDLSHRDGWDVIEAYFDARLQKVVPWTALDRLSATAPFVQERIASSRAYGSMSVEEILGPRYTAMKQAQVNTLDSMLFLNRGDHFDARALPAEAQWAPAFGVVVADADGDGREDLFLSQNFFDVDPEISRYDAGRGLWLLGDGRGGFKSLGGPESGITIHGQQRGAAVCDFDRDGRIDLVVAQNGAETKLFRNSGARPGLRVVLVGPPGNPAGVGASLRLQNDSLQGPIREIHAGSGYWSQDSTTQVLALPSRWKRLWIRWPGGRTATIEVPDDASEVTCHFDGQVRVSH